MSKKIVGLKKKTTKQNSTSLPIEFKEFENWTFSEELVVPESEIQTLSTRENFYLDGKLKKTVYFKNIPQVVNNISQIYRYVSNELVYDENEKVKCEIIYIPTERISIVKNIVNGLYVGKSIYRTSSSGSITGASHFYYLGNEEKYWDSLPPTLPPDLIKDPLWKKVFNADGTLSGFLKLYEKTKTVWNNLFDQPDIEQLLLFQIDYYSGGVVRSSDVFEHDLVSVDGEENFALRRMLSYSLFGTEKILTSKIEYTSKEIAPLNQNFISKIQLFTLAVQDFDIADPFSPKTISFPSNKLKITSEKKIIYEKEIPRTENFVDWYIYASEEILNTNKDNLLNIYVFFKEENMQKFMEDVIANNLINVWEFFFIQNPTEWLSQIEQTGDFYFLNDDYKQAISNSKDDLVVLHQLCYDPELGIPKYEEEYDVKGRVSAQRSYNIKGVIAQVSNFSYDDVSNSTKETAVDKDGNILYILNKKDGVVVGGLVYSYYPNSNDIKQIDEYSFGNLAFLEGYIYKIKKDVRELYKVVKYDVTTQKIVLEHEFKSGSVVDIKSVEYNASNQPVLVTFFDTQNKTLRVQSYSYPDGTKERLEEIVFYNNGTPYSKTQFFYPNNLSYDLFVTKLYKIENEDWILQQEIQYSSGKEVLTVDTVQDLVIVAEYD